jgi:hypothetical protein
VITAALLAGAVGVAIWQHGRVRLRPVPVEIASGLRFADSLAYASDSGPVLHSEALAALYLERARLGLGSPFRIIDYVLRDTLLDPAARRQVAGAILGRTATGAIYTSPAEALDLLSSRGPGLGLAHRNFIEAILDEADDVRSTELALRLAYQISAASGVTLPRAGAVAVAAIAQARDRALARRDAESLLRDARRRGVDPLELVASWRVSRRFGVEKPLVEPATAAQERNASELLPRLLLALDQINDAVPRTSRERSLNLPIASAAALIGARRDAPPQAPVVVTMGGFGAYVTGAARTHVDRVARHAFVTRSRTEETLVAEYARLRAIEPHPAEAALSLITAAVAMRPYAQERPWLPGDGGPSAGDLQREFLLAGVTFDASVQPRWQPYYTRMFAEVVGDMRRVFPKLDLAGLRVRFGVSPLRERALALHDPRTRTVYLPLETSAGAIAHELSHDLDWQAAKRRYGSRNSYRTDRSMRQYRDGLAATLDRMASNEASGRRASAGGARPTEAFARGVDWIVASSLARQGILNGYLTAVQDEWLTGYASAVAPRRDTPQSTAAMTALLEITEVAPHVVAWYDGVYGSGRRLGLADAVRRTLLAPLPRMEGRLSASVGFDAYGGITRELRASPEASGGWSCLLAAPSRAGSDREALRRAMEAAAQARVTGLLSRWGEYADRTSAGWRFRSLGGAPWRPAIADSVGRELRDALLWRAARIDDGVPGADLVERAERDAAWDGCARGSKW